MTRILIIDTETTGLDPAKDAVIEVAAIVYDLAYGPIESYASLIRSPVPNNAAGVNGIRAEALADAPGPDAVWPEIGRLVSRTHACVAHRASFDEAFVTKQVALEMRWVCSKFDLPWPRGQVGDSLVQLALAHDLAVLQAHRAMDDCVTLSRLFSRARELGADLEAMLRHGMRPKATFQALVTFEQKDLAKNAKFEWQPETKRWLRRMAIEDALQLGFPVKEVAA